MQWSVQVWITSHGKHYLLSVRDFEPWNSAFCGCATPDVLADKPRLKPDTPTKPWVPLVRKSDDHTYKQTQSEGICFFF